VTSQGHPHRQFAAAVEARNYPVAFVLARELAPLSLDDALSLLTLIAEKDPDRFEPAAVRWQAG
jgi:hypothetical protein